MALLATQDTALEPVRQAMLRRAAEQADQIVSQARAAATAAIADARHAAEAAVGRARISGAAQAEPVAAAELSRSRRAARSVALGAALTAHDELAGRIRAAVLALRDEPGYPGLRDALAARAGRAAGPQAEIAEHPAGGVIARAGGIVVDCSLPRLADRAVEALGARIAGLCGP
jgi:hypothetical protein